MRIGITILPQDPWAVAADKWRGADELGFDHAWTYDHLSWRTLADEPWFATMPTLTAAATVTSRVRLGTIVSSPNFRHPVPFAKEVATVDEISGGRFLLGIGGGGTGFDAFVLGDPEYTPRQRHERFAEFVDDLDLLLRHEQRGSGGVSFAGDWYTAVGARMVGDPAQNPRVPFVIAANGPKGLGIAARHAAGWVTTGTDGAEGEDWWASVAAISAKLDGALERAERPAGSIDRYLMLDSGGAYSLESVATFEDKVARAEALGFTDVITHWPRENGLYAGDEQTMIDAVSSVVTTR